MSIDMLNFEAVKEGVENLTKQLCEKDRTDELWDENFIDKTRPYYKIGCWQSRYQSLADATRLSIEAIEANREKWTKNYQLKDDEEEEYAINKALALGVVAGLKIALEVLTSKIK